MKTRSSAVPEYSESSRTLLALLLISVFAAPALYAQPGQVDLQFRALISHRGYVEALAQQPDGRFYAAGFFDQINGVARPGLARLWPNGEVDASFVPVPCLNVNALAVQSDGKLLANLGFSGVPNRVVRMHPDGRLDASFTAFTDFMTRVLAVQSDGKVLVAGRGITRLHPDGTRDTSFSVSTDAAVEALVLLPNGQLLIGGDFQAVNGMPRTRLARLNADGSVDATFVPFPTLGGPIHCLAALPQGQILVAGGFGRSNSAGGSPRRAIARLNADGSLDPLFDPGAGIGPDDVEIQSMAVQADGLVLIGGNFSQVNGFPRNALARLNADGRLDTSFINTGLSTSDDTCIRAILIQGTDRALVAGDDPVFAIGLVGVHLGPRVMLPDSLDLTFDPTRGGQMPGLATESGAVVALARQRDGKLVVGGQFSGYNGHLRRHIARLLPSGALDEAFNPGSGADGPVYAVALQANGQVLVAGAFSVFDGQPCSSCVRLNPNGSLDRSFHPVLASYGSPGSVRAIVVQRDDNILLGGSFSQVNGVARTNVARLKPDGSLDAGFVPASGAPDWYQGVVNLAVLADGKVLVGGRFLGARKLLCRLNPDGSLDSSFATDLTGYELVQFAVRSDGKIYAAGPFDLERPGWYYSRLVLVNGDGTIDPSFTADFDNTGFYCFAGLAAQPDDRLLVSGWFKSVNGAPRNRVARLTPDGRLDTSFDPGSTLGDWSPTEGARSMVLEPDGHIWLGGLVPLANQSHAALVRLEPNGQLDAPFYAQAGNVSVAGDDAWVQALATLADGRIYVGGSFDSYNNEPRGDLARLLPDGTLDRTFCPAWTSGFAVGLLALQPNGKLLAGGSSELVRFNPDGSQDPDFIGDLHGRLGMRLHCLALQADGKILLGGEFANGLARLNPNGSLDDTFHPPYLPAYDGDAVHALAVQRDGKILFGGSSAIGFQRLHPDGSVDPTFRFDGPSGSAISQILVQPDGTLLVAGQPCLLAGEEWICLARLHADGSVDESFNALAGEYVEAMAVAPDGAILAATREFHGGQPTRIRRLAPNGRADPAFQTVLGPDYYGQTLVADILVQPDGRTLLGGSFTTVNGMPVDGLARLINGLGGLAPFVQRQIVTGGGGDIRLVALPLASVSVYAVEDAPPAGWQARNISHGGVFDAATGKVKFGPFFDHEPRTLGYQVQPPVWGAHCALGVFCFTGQASADGLNSPIAGDQCQVLAGYFPADLNPADWRISMEELTAYGAAWRRGANWLCHTQGVPVDYVTRAAFLWRNGECYQVAPGVTSEPLWWVACRSASPVVRQDASPAWAERSAPPWFVPGEPLLVALAAAPAGGNTAYAVEERPPAGWTVSDISSGGEFDSVSGKVKWGPFLDSAPRTLNYRVTPPPTARGPAWFAGAASFDGVSVQAAGRRQLAEGCRLYVGSQTAPGQLQLRCNGRAGVSFVLETSTDLMTWTPCGTVTNGDSGLWFTTPVQPGAPQRFFRARAEE